MRRVGIIDWWRGWMILGVTLYHALYDWTIYFGHPLPWFTNLIVFRGAPWILAGSFMLMSGISCHYTKSNWRRGTLTLGIGLGLTVVTMWFSPANPIRFGIMHLLGCCMLLFPLLWPLLRRLHYIPGLLLCFFLFLFTFNIYYRGTLGFPGLWEYVLPRSFYENNWAFIFGMPYPGFASADYYPLVPWVFLFFTGAYIGVWFKQDLAPGWMYKPRGGVITWIGRRTMPIYLLHQPLLLPILAGLSQLITKGSV